MKNFYEIIGVEPNADFASIKSAYLKKIKEYHPDVYEGDKDFAEQKTAEITEAYNVLKDEQLRKEYDLKNNIKTTNVNEQQMSEDADNLNEDKVQENLFKDFGSGIKNFFKGLKDDLSNFGKNIKTKNKLKNNNKKISKNKNNKNNIENVEDLQDKKEGI